MGAEPWDDKGLVQEVADDIRARIQDELVDMVGHAPLGVAGMSGRRVLITGPVDLLGRPARAGARAAIRTSR